jgi:transposase, IS5 family
LYPKASALQGVISLIRAETWERINQLFIDGALDAKIECAKVVWIDSTVADSLINVPLDSSLLGDVVRVMDRMMKDARQRCPELNYTCHQRVVKNKKLIKSTRKTISAVKGIVLSHKEWLDWTAQAAHVVPLVEHIIDQAERKVVKDENVPLKKRYSACSGRYGHYRQGQAPGAIWYRINFSSGKHSMILDTVIESGNPADSSRLMPTVKRLNGLNEVYGKLPNQVAADAGYANTANIAAAKELGIKAAARQKNVV